MITIKCKMCGGDMETNESMTYGICSSCGSPTTLPNARDEQRVNLYNRANYFRRINEFDKALSAYESILNEDNAAAEAHWGAALSKYGIEYVEDPDSHQMVPTCHRVQFESILKDPDYIAALEHTQDIYSKNLYQQEAIRISEIQKDILAVSSNEEPFDIFICYKELTETGTRTADSVLAQDIYYQLTEEGYRVFFSKITLEDKIGKEYEPYIFAALNSSKIMIVVGTSAEYFNTVWIRNEWNRFLALMLKDKSKVLIPCYKNIELYDLPEALSTMQSLDMSKIGFMQDLVRGIKKIYNLNKQENMLFNNLNDKTRTINKNESAVKRAFLFIEDGEYEQADKYLEQVLNEDPETSHAYIGKLMIELKLRNEDGIVNFIYTNYLKEVSLLFLRVKKIESIDDVMEADLISKIQIITESADIIITKNKNYKNAIRFASNIQEENYQSLIQIALMKIKKAENVILESIDQKEAFEEYIKSNIPELWSFLLEAWATKPIENHEIKHELSSKVESNKMENIDEQAPEKNTLDAQH